MATTPTIDEIKTQILDKKAEYESLEGLNSTSKLAIYNLWAYCVATVIWVLYEFFTLYTEETDQKIKEQKAYSILWFRDKALAYRHGHPLEADGYSLGYIDDNYTEAEIEEAEIVQRAAVIELEVTNRIILFVKCAAEVGGELEQLTADQKSGLVSYFQRIKPAGTKLEVFSDAADDLKLEVNFYYDPLVLTSSGARIDGTTNTPVQDAVRDYLKNLRFNGEFSVAELEDLLQSVSGCSDREAYITSAAANYQTPEAFTEVEDVYIANAGYMAITDENLKITFIAKTVTT